MLQFISNIKQDEVSISQAIDHNRTFYGLFGGSWTFAISGSSLNVMGFPSNYEPSPHQDMNWLVPKE